MLGEYKQNRSTGRLPNLSDNVPNTRPPSMTPQK